MTGMEATATHGSGLPANRLHDRKPVMAPATAPSSALIGSFIVRVSAMLAVLVMAPLVEQRDGLLVGLIGAFAWVPVISAVDWWRRRGGGLGANWAAICADWGLLITLAILVPEMASMAALTSLALVALWARVDVRWLGLPAAGLSIVPVTIALLGYSAPPAVVGGAPFVFMVVVASLFWLQRESTRERQSTQADLSRLHDRSAAILTGVGEAIVVTDGQGRLREANRAAHHVLGIPADATGMACSQLLGLRDGIRQLDCWQGCALLGLPGADSGDAEVTRRLAGDMDQPLLAGVQQVGEGTRAEVVHSFRDITRLRQAEEAKALFLATTSHELKTPITVIQGFTELLMSGHAKGHKMEEAALGAVHRRAQELGSIVDRMLLSSRIQHGQVDLTTMPVRVGPVIAERVEALDAVTQHDLTVRIEPNLPIVIGDPTAVATVVDHLLENAVKYSPDGSPISVCARGVGNDVEIDVTDYGIGMTAEQVEHCFEQFWQAEASDVRRYGGTGIGLYIVHSLVTAMGGRISVASTLGEGTTFTVRLGGDHAEPPPSNESDAGPPDAPESIIQEFMRQIGVGAETPQGTPQ